MDRLSMMLFKVQCRHHSLREVSMALIFPPPEIPLAFVVIIFISVNDLHAVDCCLVYYGGFHEILANLITYFKYSHRHRLPVDCYRDIYHIISASGSQTEPAQREQCHTARDVRTIV